MRPPAHAPLLICGRYDADLLEEDAVLEWYAQEPAERKKASQEDAARGVAAREAATPFVNWLWEAEEEEEADGKEGEEDKA